MDIKKSDLEVDAEFHEDFKKDQRRKNKNHFELTHILNSDGSIRNSYPRTCNENGGQ